MESLRKIQRRSQGCCNLLGNSSCRNFALASKLIPGQNFMLKLWANLGHSSVKLCKNLIKVDASTFLGGLGGHMYIDFPDG
jgi:hypothetical protein